MELINAIKGRRSVRKFKNEKISRAMVEKIIDIARWAPTASDRQSYRFIVVDDEKIKEKLVRMGAAVFVKTSPMGILVLYSNETSSKDYGDYIQSASAAIQNILLVAYSMNIGTCWICHLPNKSHVRRLFGIPRNYDPIAYIVMGYYDRELKPPPRKYGINELVSYNRFDFREIKEKMTLKGRIYSKLPPTIKKKLRYQDDYWCRKCGSLVINCRCNHGDNDSKSNDS